MLTYSGALLFIIVGVYITLLLFRYETPLFNFIDLNFFYFKLEFKAKTLNWRKNERQRLRSGGFLSQIGGKCRGKTRAAEAAHNVAIRSPL